MKINFKFITHISVVNTIIIFFILFWFFMMIFYPRQIPENSPLNNSWFVIGLGVGMVMFAIFFIGYRELQKSPIITWPGGWDTLHSPVPTATYEFPPHKGVSTFKYPLVIYPRKSFKIPLVDWPGGGRDGYYVIEDVPGMIERRGHNIHINTAEFISYLPDELSDHWNHSRLENIYLNIASKLESMTGATFSRNARFDLALVPSEGLIDKINKGLKENGKAPISAGAWDDLVNIPALLAQKNDEIKHLKRQIDRSQHDDAMSIALVNLAKDSSKPDAQNTQNSQGATP